MHNVKLTIAYDGTHYRGWQATSIGPSIEESLKEVLERILQESVLLQAASRTDAGVHAKGQVVNFLTAHQTIDLAKFKHSLNSLLPKDIVILSIENAQPDFHPTLGAIGKEYHYSICNGTIQMPHRRLFSWHFFLPLDISLMRQAADLLIGTHDFKAFCNVKKNESYSDHTCCLDTISIDAIEDDRLKIKIIGNRFLYKMVRNLVGTLVYVGCGKLNLSQISEILEMKDRTKGGVTAPAHGLTLFRVLYPPASQ